MRRIISIIVWSSIMIGLPKEAIIAQEFDFEVRILTPNINKADPMVFKTLEREIAEFFNNTKWTDDEYESEEKIEGSIQLTLKEEISNNSFLVDMSIQSIRPTFNSSYKTKLLNLVDKGVLINYVENQPIRKSDINFFDNMSSILTFYAYVILGFDYDSFALNGGEKYFLKAQTLINSLPTGVTQLDNSWTNNNRNRGRYWLIENLYNPKMYAFRKAFYEYHRHGLDMIYEDISLAKANMKRSLMNMDKCNTSNPNTMLLQLWTDAKFDEIIDIFVVDSQSEKRKIYQYMINIDPFRATTYAKLLQ